MDGTTVQAIRELAVEAAGRTVEIAGVTYSTTALHDARKPDPTCEPVKLHTLAGLVTFVEMEAKDVPEDYALHVVSHREVRLLDSDLHGEFRQRELYATAGHEELFGGSFRFGQFCQAEEFVIGLQSLFVDADDRKKVLGLVGNLREESVKTTGDDGITQTVTARAGIVVSEEVRVPNPVKLRPYRTFREVAQPASQFILRLQGGKAGAAPPVAALFEADGGGWKLEAIELVAAYLRAKLPGITVIA